MLAYKPGIFSVLSNEGGVSCDGKEGSVVGEVGAATWVALGLPLFLYTYWLQLALQDQGRGYVESHITSWRHLYGQNNSEKFCFDIGKTGLGYKPIKNRED